MKPPAKKVVRCVGCSQVLTIANKSRTFVVEVPHDEDIVYNLTSINEEKPEFPFAH